MNVLEGFNGTIFAYGQTGSGKTYTITGSPKNYNDRGIIPRSIQYIFAHNEKISAKPTIYISYMEIYNEVGYDLLGVKQHRSVGGLEELPRIALLEDRKGEAHIRNLSVLPVATEQEAMRLLFLGDTNRTIAETPMNEYSSRSHCIFTIYITYRNESSHKVRFSKLHLVDLAGSERVYKSSTSGTALSEAKYINLSLHFLQQVILALSESKRSHIPYRNSMMTYILKDSLCGNCLTVMLATLAVTKQNIQETISTCNFAQRVSVIKTEPVINEITDPQQEILYLRNKVEELQKQLSLNGFTTSSSLSTLQQDQCKLEVENFLTDKTKEIKVDRDFTKIQFCFDLLKSEANLQKKMYDEQKLEIENHKIELSTLKTFMEKKEKELNDLKNLIDKIPEHPVNPKNNITRNSRVQKDIAMNQIYTQSKNLPSSYIYQTVDEIKTVDSVPSNTLFEIFLTNSGMSQDMFHYKKSLENKLEMAKLYAEAIEQCQINITYIRQKLEVCTNCTEKSILVSELEQQQDIYIKALDDMKIIKNETFHLESGLRQLEIQIIQKFKIWLESKHSERNSSYIDNMNCNECCRNIIQKQSCTCQIDNSCRTSRINLSEERSISCNDRCYQNIYLGGTQNYSNPPVENTLRPCSLYTCSNIVTVPTNKSRTNLREADCGRRSKNCYLPEQSIFDQSLCNCRKIHQTIPVMTESYFVPSNDSATHSNLSDASSFVNKILENHIPIKDNQCSENLRKDTLSANSSWNNNNCFEAFRESSFLSNTKSFIESENDCFKTEKSEDIASVELMDINNFREEVPPIANNFFKDTDSMEFRKFMETVSLTGENEIDEEIFNFYRTKFP